MTEKISNATEYYHQENSVYVKKEEKSSGSSSRDHPENIFTNGTVVSREVSHLEVTVDLEQLKQQYTSEVIASLAGYLTSFKENTESYSTVVLPLTELPIQKKITIAGSETVDLHVKARDWTKDLDVRLGYDLCSEEKHFLKKRRKYVAAAVKKAVHLQEELQDDEVPVVAIMTTGGGIRSFTAMYGSLLGLQKLNLLDSITYLTGLSGTTWTMGKLYEDPDWSHTYMEEAINKAQKQVTKCKLCCFSVDNLKYYYHELKKRTEEGFDTSFIDLWGLKDDHILSNEQLAVSQGQNPLPIYLAVSLKKDYSAQDFREWVEFTPYEVGSFKYGAYIRVEDFGSDFFMGRVMKRLPEMRICFMQDTVLDTQPNKLMETAEQPLSLVDTGFFINTSYPPLLIPQRKVDVILHLNYSGGVQTKNLDQFSIYAAELGIPFPKIEISEEDRRTNLKECYVFEDKENVEAPIVLFFPLTNDTFRKCSEPGVERTPANMEEGNVDVSTIFSPFTTREVCFSKANFGRLVNLTEYNILNNEKKIIEALRVAVERRKQRKS
ncbi:hypothetical protein JD844_021308 [Phrynosoma platyrhinos]|uniref:PLA2c domain-containing protein n=1 Tax=Phrynosoma platyrhinos TaxID=52577 RepID=A0ABQ7STQ5_PHRPL|nr:hypothetical protein JD844_021308 [Phrynosoma platyrhinos]